MKRALTTAGFALALLLCLGAALAAGGDAGDPLLSLSYLTEQFSKTADAAVEARLDAADSSLRESLERPAAPLSSSGEELLLNEGDALSGGTGRRSSLWPGTCGFGWTPARWWMPPTA